MSSLRKAIFGVRCYFGQFRTFHPKIFVYYSAAIKSWILVSAESLEGGGGDGRVKSIFVMRFSFILCFESSTENF